MLIETGYNVVEFSARMIKYSPKMSESNSPLIESGMRAINSSR